MKYREWLAEWLGDIIRRTVKETTRRRYGDVIRLYINPSLGETELKDITALTLQRFVSELQRRGLSASYINIAVTVLQGSLKSACSMRLIDAYEADRIKRPKVEEKKVECFTLKEQKRIEEEVQKCPKTHKNGIILCLYTGLRIGELLALKWEDVDFVKRTITVRRSCHDGHVNGSHTRIIDTPKTTSSRRVIPFPRALLPILKRMKSKSEFVVSNGDKPVFVRSYQAMFASLLKKLGIPHRGFHALRHTFATRALECGMDVKTLSEILGHKSSSVTLNRYAHSMLEHKAQMMDKLGRLL